MQGLVFIFIGLCGAALGAAAYFALGFTPIEAGLLALVVILGGVLIEERAARRRAFARLEAGVEEMGRLLATDAKAGQVLSQRVNAIVDLDLGPRLDVVEADMSVLGTVVRQVAEAVSELETAQASLAPASSDRAANPEPRPRRPIVPLDDVRRALDDGRIVHHVQPVLTLPQRKLHALDLVPRLELDGELIDPPQFLPIPTGEGTVILRRIDLLSAEEAVRIVRRARLGGDPVRLLVDLSPATLDDKPALERLLALLAANRAVNSDIAFALDYQDWTALSRPQADGLASLVQQGVTLALRNATTLRLDFAGLAEKGVRHISTSGGGFIANTSALTDFHSSDINDYIKRFGINLVLTGLEAESEVLALLDDGIRLAQGRVLGDIAPLRPDLRDDGDDSLRRAVSR
ncbi:EAL domain-containing protein [Pelagibacterium sp. H642]|uniref:EAL domain-containing protein n=1 Tax=Pelagibacterium sp. H642 TaxID=1881069 RepID=UPI0028168240|nr:EAL domain-containing protein [Pelagibacterium sp. H642]WMT91424.1 EAL domain-containing protein [Pelagibacterium sp. H642]